MNILAIAAHFPMPDRAAGDLRFFEILSGLAERHNVRFCAYKTPDSLQAVDTTAYRIALERRGITVLERNPIASLRSGLLDLILFEFHFAARSYLDAARFWQPAARVLVDSVDIHFARFFAKARITGAEKDYSSAQAMKEVELAIYGRADVVIAVSEEDKKILEAEAKDLHIEVIPNIHATSTLPEGNPKLLDSLIFVGNFRHDPNVDGLLYFCEEVWPLIKKAAPDTVLTVVGSSPPEEVKGLASKGIKVLGFVPDIVPLLETSAISIAPLRYGGGLKGKIGEAMAYGLPVVTTSVGTEGFGLTPGDNVLVGDTPELFAAAVVDLIRDRELYERIRRAGWAFVNERYSVHAVSERIRAMIARLDRYPVKKLARGKRFAMAVQYYLDRHLSWRFRQSNP